MFVCACIHACVRALLIPILRLRSTTGSMRFTANLWNVLIYLGNSENDKRRATN